MFSLILLIGLALVVAPFAALIIALQTQSRVVALARRIDQAERRLDAATATAANATPAASIAVSPPPGPLAAPDIPDQATPASATSAAAPAKGETGPHIEAGLEERLGTQWVVWVGGAALALGGVFLVRYSIEQGLIGPRVRIFLGALLAVALGGGGEWMRRRQIPGEIASFAKADIPSILTAAATISAFATIYAAYALYTMLAPGPAFLLLGAVALAAFAAALRHGPALAALGLVGSYVTPLLIASAEPDYPALYTYLTVVTAAAFALADVRLWRWLAITAVVLAALWILPGIGSAAPEAHAFYAVAGFLLAAVFIVAGLLFGPEPKPGEVDAISSGAIAAFVLAAALLVLARHHEAETLLTFAALVAATVVVAWRAEAATGAVPAAGILAALVMAHWALGPQLQSPVELNGPLPGFLPAPLATGSYFHLLLGGAFAAVFGAAGLLAQGRSPLPLVPTLWASAATFTPLAILIAIYYRIAAFEPSIPFAAMGVFLAGMFAAATEALQRRPPLPGSAGASALFATGSVAALALALSFAFEKGWLTIALALMVPGIAWVEARRPLAFLRWLAAAIAALVLARLAIEPRVVGDHIGATPIFNWLLYGYGAPAASFWLAGRLLAKRADDRPTRAVQAAAILFTVLLVFLEIRHYVYDGDIYHSGASTLEIGLDVSTGLAIAIGLE